MSRKSDFVHDVQQNVTDLIDAYNALRANRREWDAMDYGNSNPITPDDLEGSSGMVNAGDIASAVGTTVDAIEGLLAQGHATNLYKVRL